ncbi:hypothetical protein PR202_gb22777 [Eleusine coracana subsp. coracana]|uniref:TLC domain-containing protein n=1 Tax=Eleusine coracana subsp. coracana TaxID=191504 RepID=A0AAV5FI52_ELECO|nr:hypothetical protein PR202_gb22777 [Eleusine coracana subsp. coracana]
MAALVELFLGSSSAPVDWEAEAYPAYGDFAVLPFLVAFFPAVRFLLDRLVFEVILLIPAARRFLGPKNRLKLKAVYMYAAGFYTYSIFALLFWETRRSDFGVSMSHHVATVVLIVLSYIFRFARVGSVVLALHDGSDIFLEIGKMSKYSGCEWLAVVAFLLFVLSWIVLRLIIFPFWILRSTSYEVLLTLDKEKHQFYGPIYYYVFNSLLFSLLVLHIYWWILIYRMLVKQIQSKGRVGDDVRSDSEGEDEHED